jgi:hypothetical protein
MSIVLAKTRPTHRTKGSKKIIVMLNMEKAMHWCVLLEDRCAHAVYEISCSEEGFIPIAQ